MWKLFAGFICELFTIYLDVEGLEEGNSCVVDPIMMVYNELLNGDAHPSVVDQSFYVRGKFGLQRWLGPWSQAANRVDIVVAC